MNAVAKIDFDYGALDATMAANLQKQADRIRKRVARQTLDMIETGRDLLAVKEQLEHGAFTQWVEGALTMPMRTAQGYMRAAQWAEQEAKNANFALLQATTVQRLAAPSCPQGVRDAVLTAVKSGKAVADKDVAASISAAREKRRYEVEKQRRIEQRNTSPRTKARLEKERQLRKEETAAKARRTIEAARDLAKLMHQHFPEEAWSKAIRLLAVPDVCGATWDEHGIFLEAPLLKAAKAISINLGE